MTSAALREKVESLRQQLRQAEQDKVDATDRKAFAAATETSDRLAVDIEFTQQQVSRAEQSERDAERAQRKLELGALLPHVTPDAIGAELGPLVQHLANAHRAHVDAIRALEVLAASKHAQHAKAAALAGELGEPIPVDPRPFQRARVEAARKLTGSEAIGTDWLTCPSDEAALLELAHGVYGVRRWTPNQSHEDPSDYPEAEQLACILNGTHDDRLRRLNAELEATRAHIRFRSAEMDRQQKETIAALVAKGVHPADADRQVKAQANAQATSEFERLKILLKSGLSRAKAFRVLTTDATKVAAE